MCCLLSLPMCFRCYGNLIFHRLIMGKGEIGIYFCVTADVLKKFLQKRFWSSPLPTIQILSKSLILIGCHGNRKAKFLKEIFKNLLLRSHKGDEAETLHKCSWHKVYFLLLLPMCFHCYGNLSFHILTMGKVEIGIYFCVTADILTKVLLKCFWSSPVPTIWFLSKSLVLIGGHGNRKTKFSREKKNLQKR